MSAWTVYFDDGKTFTPKDGTPADAPAFGVQAVVSTETDGRKALTLGDDFYYWDPNYQRWFGVELTGLIDWLTRIGLVKLGRFIPQSQFEPILRLAAKEAGIVTL